MIIIGSFGERFRQERERQGYTLAMVAEETKIRTLYLRALEEENFASLPARVYAVGFVASYARFLQMDVDSIVSEFKQLAYSPLVTPPAQTAKRRRRKFKLPLKKLITAVAFLAVALWLGNYVVDSIAQRTATPPQVVYEEPSQGGSEPTPSVPEVQPKTEKLILAVNAQQSCWVRVKVDGEEQYQGTMVEGEKQTFEANNNITIRAGNAGGIDLTLNNQLLAPLGDPWQVAEKSFDLSSISKE